MDLLEMPLHAPDGACGEWRVDSFEIDAEAATRTQIRAVVTGNHREYIAPGTYKRLMRGNTVVMSNTPMEVDTNRSFVKRAHGRVLINGLGLGMVLQAVLRKPEVSHVTVIEISAEVIALVGPSFKDNPKVRIVQADALEYQPQKGEKFDAVWHDIWDDITADNLAQMHRLHRKYGRRASWQGSWCRAQCEAALGKRVSAGE